MPTGGRSRKDTQAQQAARQRVAETLRCPDCLRRNALSRAYREEDETGVTITRYCRYCQAPRVTRVEYTRTPREENADV